MSKTNNIDDFEAVFKMEPKEILDYFNSKGLRPSFDWHEAYEEAHAKAFTIAKMTDIDLLKDTKKLLEKALKDGQSYSSFKKEAQELFKKKGWIDYKEVVNPKTGKKQTVELGTPRRIKKIYDCNMSSAYAVGRYKEQLEEMDIAPYLQYMAIMDESTRPEHQALHGKVFRADDAFWANFYPPNGWGCRCFVRNLTKYQVEKANLKIENTNGKISNLKGIVGDREVDIPVYKFDNAGIPITMQADKGWSVNLGTHAWGIDVQAWNKIENLSEDLKYSFISKMAQNPHNEQVFKNLIDEVVKNNFKAKNIEKPLTWISADLFKKINEIEVKNPIIVFQDDRVGHIIGARAKLSADKLKEAYSIINNPDEIYFDYTTQGKVGLVYIRIIKNSDECYKVCVKLAQKHKKTKEEVNYISTMAKVKQLEMQDKKIYKKIE